MRMSSIYVVNGTFFYNLHVWRSHRLLTIPSHDATPEIWQETYVSALLRAILYSDDPTYWLEAYRKLDPITTPDGDIRFLQAAEKLFLKGANARLLSQLVHLTSL
jgi:hypothetical protein